MRIEHYLHDAARRRPDHPALIVGEQHITYREVDELAGRLAHALRCRGIEPGDRVLVLFDNALETVVSLFGSLRAGAVFSIVNPTTKADKLAFMLNNCQARCLITRGRHLAVAAEAVRHAPSVSAVLVADAADLSDLPGAVAWKEALESASPDSATDAGIDLDLAMIGYTSGTTGLPKGVMLTHRNLLVAAQSIVRYLGNTPDDRLLCVLPLSFGYGLTQIFTSVLVGATVVLERSFAFPFAVLQKMARERVTGFALVPTIAAILVNMEKLPEEGLGSLRYITNAAAALPPAHIARLQTLFPAARIYSMYGQTECTRVCYLPPEQLAVRPGSVGKAIPNTEAYVVDEHGQRVGPGVVGELVVRGGHVMVGYWENPEATAEKLRPGRYPWERVLYTGDLFRTDEEGYLWFVSRKDDIIKTRGEKVSPKEVENVIYQLPGVKEAAVVGIPDPILGQAVKAVIVPVTEGCLKEKEVIGYCKEHLEDFMVPKVVEFRTELPKTDSGKIKRGAVEQAAQQP